LMYILLLRFCKLIGDFVISPLPPVWLEFLHHSRASSLHGHYPASPLLQAPPSPSRRPPTSRLYRLYGFPAPRISPRDEEGFSSCLRRPCHRAVANAPPEHLAASVSCDDLFCLHPPIVGSASGSRILEVTYAFIFITAR